MGGKLRRWWPVLKAALCVAILVAIGRQFAHDLRRPDLWQRPFSPGWLALSGVLYLAGIGFSALYWYRLLGHLGQRPTLPSALRAYYIGHLGKYLPGKAWALFLRASLVRGQVRLSLATLTSFYEVLTTMTAGALLAAGLFALLAPAGDGTLGWTGLQHLLRLETPPGGVIPRRAAVLLALGLGLGIGLPLQPALFNRLVHRMALPFRERDAADLPRIRLVYLLEGLLLTGMGWLLLGCSLAAVLEGIAGSGHSVSAPELGRLAAIMGLSYVVGFVILVAPSGLGVREFFLTLFLVPELTGFGLEEETARGVAILAVLLLRLVWTAAELVLVGFLWWLPQKKG